MDIIIQKLKQNPSALLIIPIIISLVCIWMYEYGNITEYHVVLFAILVGFLFGLLPEFEVEFIVKYKNIFKYILLFILVTVLFLGITSDYFAFLFGAAILSSIIFVFTFGIKSLFISDLDSAPGTYVLSLGFLQIALLICSIIGTSYVVTSINQVVKISSAQGETSYVSYDDMKYIGYFSGVSIERLNMPKYNFPTLRDDVWKIDLFVSIGPDIFMQNPEKVIAEYRDLMNYNIQDLYLHTQDKHLKVTTQAYLNQQFDYLDVEVSSIKFTPDIEMVW